MPPQTHNIYFDPTCPILRLRSHERTNATLHSLFRFTLLDRNTLNLTLHFSHCIPQTLKLRPCPPIRLCKLAKLPILPRQLPPQVQYRRLKPADLDVMVLRNEPPTRHPSSTNSNCVLSDSRSLAFCVPISLVAPAVGARSSRKSASEGGERTSPGFSGSFLSSTNSWHVTARSGTFGPRRRAPPWTFLCGQSCNAFKFPGFERTRTFKNS
jgi:hypothetical protein